MPEEAVKETNKPVTQEQVEPVLPSLTPEQNKRANSIFKISQGPGSRGRVMQPEPPIKPELFPSMEDAARKAIKEGDADTTGATARNIQTIKEELRTSKLNKPS